MRNLWPSRITLAAIALTIGVGSARAQSPDDAALVNAVRFGKPDVVRSLLGERSRVGEVVPPLRPEEWPLLGTEVHGDVRRRQKRIVRLRGDRRRCHEQRRQSKQCPS